MAKPIQYCKVKKKNKLKKKEKNRLIDHYPHKLIPPSMSHFRKYHYNSPCYQGRIQSIIPDSDLSRIQSVIKFCQACQFCLVKISSKCTSLFLVKESFCLAPGICTCCCVCSTNYSDVTFRSQLPLRNLYKPLIWVSCFHQVLPLYLDFLNIVFNTIVIAHLTPSHNR